MSEIRYSKDLLWVKPYVDAVAEMVPLNRLTSITGYKVPIDKVEQCSALISKCAGWYRITIRNYRPDYESLGDGKFVKNGHKREYVAVILENLSHELAHLKIWEHTPDHLLLQARLLTRMARQAKKQGLKDTFNRTVYRKISKEEEEQF